MAVSTASKRLALDTNVLVDRANGEVFAKDFCEIFQDRNYSLEIPPTVIAELAYFQRRGNAAEQKAAEVALLSMIAWGLTPIALRDVEKSYKKNFIEIAKEAQLLPPKEINDLYILAETAIANIPALVTSDRALLNIDLVGLQIAFQDAGLPSVSPVHPARMIRALR